MSLQEWLDRCTEHTVSLLFKGALCSFLCVCVCVVVIFKCSMSKQTEYTHTLSGFMTE